jgi:large-conductance mechanosensitive channel
MLFEIFVMLWLVLLAFSVYFFVKSLNEAIAKGREQKMEPEREGNERQSVSLRTRLHLGHRREPVH